MILEEYLNEVNEKVKVLIGEKLSVDTLHEKFSEIINPINKDCKYNFWSIYHKGHKLFECDIERKDDKRSIYHIVTRVINVSFKINKEYSKYLKYEFTDFLKEITLEEEYVEYIGNYKYEIAYSYKKIEKLKEEVEKNIAMFKEKHGDDIFEKLDSDYTRDVSKHIEDIGIKI